MLQNEAAIVLEIHSNQLKELEVGTPVRCVWMQGSEGVVIECIPSDSILSGPSFRVRWNKLLLRGVPVKEVPIKSGLLSYNDLCILNPTEGEIK